MFDYIKMAEVEQSDFEAPGVWAVVKEMAERIQKLEATVGYLIYIQKIAPPTVIENETGDD